MSKYKKIIILVVLVVVFSAISITAFAISDYKTPAEALAALTNRTVESVKTERKETGKSFGKIAKEADKLDEFKLERIQIFKDRVNEKVLEGKITQEQADNILQAIDNKQANCDGNGAGKLVKELKDKLKQEKCNKREEFKLERVQKLQDRLDEKVAAGKITQEEADTILQAIEDNQANCDGNGLGSIMKQFKQNQGQGGKSKFKDGTCNNGN